MTMMMRHNSRLELAARAVLPTGVAVSVTSPTAEPDPLWPVEVVVIMAAPSAYRECVRHRVTPTAGSPNPLLVVEPLGRHVGHHHCKERSDIHAGFHGRRDAEQVDRIG